jgi:hypothetical protein
MPDALFSNQISKFGKFLEGLEMEDVGIFCGHLVHFTVFCYILWTSGIVRGNLVHFPPFWYFVPRKIWQPCSTMRHLFKRCMYLYSIYSRTFTIFSFLALCLRQKCFVCLLSRDGYRTYVSFSFAFRQEAAKQRSTTISKSCAFQNQVLPEK